MVMLQGDQNTSGRFALTPALSPGRGRTLRQALGEIVAAMMFTG
jgi:hypothetical protein